MAPVSPDYDEEFIDYSNTAALNSAMTGGSYQMDHPHSYPSPSAPSTFVVREQARDGNCLFRSFSDQLYGSPDHHAMLRDRCSMYIASERNYFEQFVAEPWDEFLVRIQREGEWGDDVEIEALSEIYDCRVEIYACRSHSLMRTFHEACEAKWPQPIRLLYEGQSHYNSLAPRSGLLPVLRRRPGEMEDSAIRRSRKRNEAGLRREGIGETDAKLTEQQVLDDSVRLSRLEFEHMSQADMDKTLEESRLDWERSERKRMDEEVVDAILQQSVLEEEQKQLTMAMKESKEEVIHNDPNFAALYGMVSAPESIQERVPGASSSSGNEQENRDSRDFQYPESVYAVMSMGFPLEKCIQAYNLVGDNPEGILQYCCQNLGF